VGLFDRFKNHASVSPSSDDASPARVAAVLGTQLPDPALGMVDGVRHYTGFVEEIKAFKRVGRLEEAEQLLLRCCDATEDEARVMSWGPPAPWYYEQLAIIYRRQKETSKEVAILERYVENAGLEGAERNTTGRQLVARLAKARALAANGPTTTDGTG